MSALWSFLSHWHRIDTCRYIQIHTDTYIYALYTYKIHTYTYKYIQLPLGSQIEESFHLTENCFTAGTLCWMLSHWPASQSVCQSMIDPARRWRSWWQSARGLSRALRWRDVNLKWPPRRDISYHRWHIMFDAFPLARQSVCLSVHHWPRPPLEGPVVVGPRDEETWTWSGHLEETFRFTAGTRHRNAVDFDRIFGVYLVVSVPLPPFLAYNTWHLASKCSHKQKFQDFPNGCSVWVICFRFEHCFQVSRIYFDCSFDLCCKSALLT